MSTMTPDANSILMSGGGAFASFKEHGDTITGTVTQVGEPYQVREWNQATSRSDGPPKFTKAGKPVYAFHVSLATDERDQFNPDDDGERTIDVNSWRMQDALRAAIKGAGAPGLEIGAQVTLTYTKDEVQGDSRSGKHYAAQYVRPANVALMGGGQPAAAPAPAPAPVVQQAPAPAAPAPVAVAAPAPAAAATQSPADLAKQLIGVGLDDTAIAAATQLDPAVVAAIRAA
ncbi:hypothetical protein ACFS27_03270 [Promicromonospora vindobonensis]|uniref:Single-stranded DNA-binding protein n=1 Tax=Promicromonospora vindobonensis TaxID=195748 RepID=A0ABW5VNG6_9MICO